MKTNYLCTLEYFNKQISIRYHRDPFTLLLFCCFFRASDYCFVLKLSLNKRNSIRLEISYVSSQDLLLFRKEFNYFL